MLTSHTPSATLGGRGALIADIAPPSASLGCVSWGRSALPPATRGRHTGPSLCTSFGCRGTWGAEMQMGRSGALAPVRTLDLTVVDNGSQTRAFGGTQPATALNIMGRRSV
jgi:hypothetical protein